jgi:hypothetical protein
MTDASQASRPRRSALLGRRWLRRAYGPLALALLFTLPAAWWLHGARARAHEALLDVGSQLLHFTGGLPSDAPRTLRVNGAALHLASGHVDGPVSALLDAFHDRCRRAGSVLAPEPASRTTASRSTRVDSGARPRFEPVIRAAHGAAGYLGCLAFRPAELTAPDLLHAVRAFTEGGDLAALGDLRFVWAMRDGGGTAFVAIASEGSLPLAKLFPERGDAPGVDFPTLPRPPGARRTLSAYQEDEAPLLVSYRVEDGAEGAYASYRGTLIDGGFVIRDVPAEPGGPRILHARRGQRSATAVVTAIDASASSVTLLPLE